jgi:hypothetical protein
LDAFGTGFLVSASGQILTNHHVAEPWWQNDDLKEMLDQGLEPVIAEMTAYFPGIPRGVAINAEKISSTADVAVVKGNVSALGIKQIALADGHRSAVSGGPVVLLGYPTALHAILARAGVETLRSIATASKGDPKQVVEELARRNLIRPVTTQGTSATCCLTRLSMMPKPLRVVPAPPYGEVNACSSSRAISLKSFSRSIPVPLFIISCSSRIVLFVAK